MGGEDGSCSRQRRWEVMRTRKKIFFGSIKEDKKAKNVGSLEV